MLKNIPNLVASTWPFPSQEPHDFIITNHDVETALTAMRKQRSRPRRFAVESAEIKEAGGELVLN